MQKFLRENSAQKYLSRYTVFIGVTLFLTVCHIFAILSYWPGVWDVDGYFDLENIYGGENDCRRQTYIFFMKHALAWVGDVRYLVLILSSLYITFLLIFIFGVAKKIQTWKKIVITFLFAMNPIWFLYASYVRRDSFNNIIFLSLLSFIFYIFIVYRDSKKNFLHIFIFNCLSSGHFW